MEDTTKDFLKSAFWGKKRTPIESYTKWGDGTKENPFLLVNEEINDYVGSQYSIIEHLYGSFKLKSQVIDIKNIDALKVEYNHWNNKKFATIYFDISECL